MPTRISTVAVVVAAALISVSVSQADAQVGIGHWAEPGMSINGATMSGMSAGTLQLNSGSLSAQPTLPRLGFFGYLAVGQALQVAQVAPFSRAAAMGLEPGDLILQVNGVPMTYAGAYEQALGLATINDGWVTLQIRDWRTGMVVARTTKLY